MPWKENPETKEKDYELSLYAKEELPTWSEVFNDWFNGKHYIYDPNYPSHQELDKYWKIPRKKYLLAIVCNQFNKTLFEDGKKEKLLDFINNETKVGYGWTAVDVRFVIEGLYPDNLFPEKYTVDEYNKITSDRLNEIFVNDGSTTPPPIYTIPLPTGKDNVFIVNGHPRAFPYTHLTLPTIRLV